MLWIKGCDAYGWRWMVLDGAGRLVREGQAEMEAVAIDAAKVWLETHTEEGGRT